MGLTPWGLLPGQGRVLLGLRSRCARCSAPLEIAPTGTRLNKNELIQISPSQSLGSQFLSFPPSPLRCDRCYFISCFSSPIWVLELSRGDLGEAHPGHVPNAFPCTWHLSRSFTLPYPVPFPSPHASLLLSFPTCSPQNIRGHYFQSVAII